MSAFVDGGIGVEAEVYLAAGITVISGIMFILSVAAYMRTRHIRMLGVTGIFLVFLIKGLLYSLALFYSDVRNAVYSSTVIISLDLAVLAILFLISWPGETRRGK